MGIPYVGEHDRCKSERFAIYVDSLYLDDDGTCEERGFLLNINTELSGERIARYAYPQEGLGIWDVDKATKHVEDQEIEYFMFVRMTETKGLHVSTLDSGETLRYFVAVNDDWGDVACLEVYQLF